MLPIYYCKHQLQAMAFCGKRDWEDCQRMWQKMDPKTLTTYCRRLCNVNDYVSRGIKQYLNSGMTRTGRIRHCTFLFWDTFPKCGGDYTCECGVLLSFFGDDCPDKYHTLLMNVDNSVLLDIARCDDTFQLNLHSCISFIHNRGASPFENSTNIGIRALQVYRPIYHVCTDVKQTLRFDSDKRLVV